MVESYNASASAFGWHFQINAAIVFFLNEIKNIESIRVEGANEDIELFLKNGNRIFIQAKSKSKIGADTQALSKLAEGLKTLIHASNNNCYEKLYYTTNFPNPIGGRINQYNIFMGGLYVEHNYKTLSESVTKSAESKISKVESEYNLSFDTNNFYIAVIPFDGEIKTTRERYINSRVKEFLNSISVKEGMSNDLLEIWQSEFFFNSSTTNIDIELSKKQLIWPIVVLNLELTADDKLLDDYEEALDLETEDIEIILNRYSEFINRQIEHIDFATRVTSDYREFKKNRKGKMRKIDFYINENWHYYKKEIFSESLDDDLLETLIKILLKKLLNKQSLVANIAREVTL